MIYINYYKSIANTSISAGKGDLTLAGMSPTLHNSADSCGLLLRFEGATLDVDENDTRTNTFYTAGSPTLSATSPKWGSGNMDIDAASTDENLAVTGSNFRTSTSASFTLEFWFYPTSEGTLRTGGASTLKHAICTICTSYPVTSTNYSTWGYLWWTEASGGTLTYTNAGISQTGVSKDTWHHVAIVNNTSVGGRTDFFVDGVRMGRLSSADTTHNFNTIYFGNMKYGGGLSDGDSDKYLVKARFDSIRFKDGVALYEGTTYTVPTADFPLP